MALPAGPHEAGRTAVQWYCDTPSPSRARRVAEAWAALRSNELLDMVAEYLGDGCHVALDLHLFAAGAGGEQGEKHQAEQTEADEEQRIARLRADVLQQEAVWCQQTLADVQRSGPQCWTRLPWWRWRRMADTTATSPELRAALLQLVQASARGEPGGAVAASNALTLLHDAHVAFVGLDLRGVAVPGADLTDAVFDKVNLAGANLRGVDLRYAQLREVNLEGADLTGAVLSDVEWRREVPVTPTAVAISTDRGEVVLFGSGEEFVSIDWAAGTNTAWHVGRHSRSCLAFSPGGEYLVVAGGSNQPIQLYDYRSKQLHQSLDSAALWSSCLTVSPNRRLLAAAGTLPLSEHRYGSIVEIFDLGTGSVVTSYSDAGSVTALVFFADSDRLLVSDFSHGGKNFVKLRSVERGVLRDYKTVHGAVHSLALTPDERAFFAAEDDHVVRLYCVATGAVLRQFCGHHGKVTQLKCSPDGRFLFSGCHFSDRSVKMWDVVSGRNVLSWERPYFYRNSGQGTEGLALTADGRSLVVVTSDSQLLVYRLPSAKAARVVRPHLNSVSCVAMSEHGEYVVAGHVPAFSSYQHQGEVQPALQAWATVYDGRGGRPFYSLLSSLPAVHSVAVNSRLGLVLASSAGGRVLIWRLQTGALQHDVSLDQSPHDPGVLSLAPNGTCFVVAGGNSHRRHGVLALWSLESGGCERVRTFSGHTSGIVALAVSPDLRYVASASDSYFSGADTSFRIWDSSTGAELHRLAESKQGSTCLAFSADSQHLVVGLQNGCVQVFHVPSGGLVSELTRPRPKDHPGPERDQYVYGADDEMAPLPDSLPAHERPIGGLCFLGDHVLATFSGRELRLWNWQTGQLLREVDEPAGFGRVSLRHSASGTFLAAAGSERKSPLLWAVPDLVAGEPLHLLWAGLSAVAVFERCQTRDCRGVDSTTLSRLSPVPYPPW